MSEILGNLVHGNTFCGRKICAGTLAVTSALAALLTCAFAQNDFPIEGTFTQNDLCRGDGTKQPFQRVVVTAQDVSYSGGVCTIDNKQQDGDKLVMRLTCKFKSGAVMASSVTFTKKDDNTFDMAQNEGTYKAVLHRCPG
ncbi:MAG TPA: hypothetical protein VKW08_19640 [Xanthobacteraceae bacterium]|nr:hypothetical protein [Xanthobacteraceae bacterium]